MRPHNAETSGTNMPTTLIPGRRFPFPKSLCAVEDALRFIASAITGKTLEGEEIKGDYKFTDEFPIAEGFEENAEFFTLTYEAPVAVSHNLAFQRIAPLLWMRAGSEGRRIDDLPAAGWDVADTYGLLVELDRAAAFCDAAAAQATLRIAYVVTDDVRRFQAVARALPDSVEPVRLYESYLSNPLFDGPLSHEVYTQGLSGRSRSGGSGEPQEGVSSLARGR